MLSIRTISMTKRRPLSAVLGGLFMLGAAACGAPEGALELRQGAVYGPPPAGWTTSVIGNLGANTTNVLYDPAIGEYYVQSGGAGLFGPYAGTGTGSDAVLFLNKAFAGDGEITADLVGASSSAAPLGAIMIRSQLNPTSSHGALGYYVQPNGFSSEEIAYRSAIGGASAKRDISWPGAWVKLVRRGNTVTAYTSQAGDVWTPTNPPLSVTLGGVGASAFYGLTVASGSTTDYFAMVYQDVRIGKLPFDLKNQDIGGPTPAGGTSINYDTGGTFVVKGAGAGIKGTSDSFQFASRPLAGNGTLVARLEPPNGPGNGRAGLMLRNGTGGNASNVFVGMTNSDELVFTSRTKNGAATSADQLFTKSFSGWVKLDRQGTKVTAYSSVDGTTWDLFASATLTDLAATA
jgi:hypothetical protein